MATSGSQRKKAWVVAIGVVVGIVVLVMVGLGVAVSRARQIIEVAQQSHEEGVAFGKVSDERGCYAQALRRFGSQIDSGRSSVVRRAEHVVFFTRCLEVTSLTPRFCDSVPPSSDVGTSGRRG